MNPTGGGHPERVTPSAPEPKVGPNAPSGVGSANDADVTYGARVRIRNGPHLTHHVTKWLREWMALSQCDLCSAPLRVGDPLARTNAGIYVCQKCGNLMGGAS